MSPRPRQDLQGTRFGKLRVVSEAPRDAQGRIQWTCRCDCGATVRTRADHLRAGATRSCGCGMRRDLHGERFGSLDVLGRADNVAAGTTMRPKGLTAWRCRCQCGREVIVPTEQLTRGTATHCGCASMRPAAPSNATPMRRQVAPARRSAPTAQPLPPLTASERAAGWKDSQLGRTRTMRAENEDAGRTLCDGDPFADAT